jgi:hypothetical protein
MSVQGIRLYIKAKRKIHDNFDHKGHRNRSLLPHSLSVNLRQILTPSSPPIATLLHSATRALADVKKTDVNCIVTKNICSTTVYFDLLNTNFNNNHAVDTIFLRLARPFYIFIFFLWRFGPYSGQGLSFHKASRQHSYTAQAIGPSGRVIRR